MWTSAIQQPAEDAVMQRLSEVTGAPGREQHGCFRCGAALFVFNVINPRPSYLCISRADSGHHHHP